jgi:Arc/MetJ-type ribon-helix-helix transcriptional regulator
MGRTTVSLDEETQEIIDEKSGDGGEYESVSAFVRDCIQRYEEIETLEETVDDLEEEVSSLREERDQLKDQADRVDDLEKTIERLRNEKQTLVEQRSENRELVRYVQEERTVEQQWREAPLWKRAKWRVMGMPSETSST